MDVDELEARLEGQAETPSLEFKAACSWDAQLFAKDMLALSNVQDGGMIIVGVEDATFVRQGTSEAQRATFNVDIMKDQTAAYADPHVNFTVEFPTDRAGLQFVVIRVSQFDEVPVICRRDSADTLAGTIYYRSRHRRVESARVANSYDMRDIIELAAIRRMQRLQRLGLQVAPGSAERFEDELKGL